MIKELDSNAGNNPVDLSVIEQLKASLGDDEEFVVELIGQFLENTPKLLDDILRAVENNDADGLQLSAHSLKSTCATLGAVTMTSLAFDLEMSGREKNMEEVAANAVKLNEAYGEAKGIYEERLNRRAA